MPTATNRRPPGAPAPLAVFADPSESAGLRRLIARGGGGGAGPIALLHTGIGPGRAGRALRARVALARPSAAISAGFAAGLGPDCSPGELAVGHPWSDPAWAGRALDAVAGLSPRRLASAPLPLRDPAAKRAFARATGAELADMETAALAAICREEGIPFLALRAVSDGPGEALPAAFLAAADAPPGGLAAAFFLAALFRPGEWPAMARMLARLPRLSARLGEAVLRAARVA